MSQRTNIETRSVQDFLKAVFQLKGVHQHVSTGSIAKALAVAAPSVTEMAERLRLAGLIHYRKYYGIRLKKPGIEIAHDVIRRHELIELYLITRLGYSMDEAHQEAEQMEHAVSARFVDALEQKLSQHKE